MTDLNVPSLDLQPLFAPRSVVLVGASSREGSVGWAILRNLVSGGSHLAIHAVNPNLLDVVGARWSPDVDSVPECCDLAIVAVPARFVPETVAALGRKGVRLAVMISAGLNAENGLLARTLEVARDAGVRLLGPNCLGALIPRAGLNASFAPNAALPGGLAFLSQSGALVTAMLDWAEARRVGFSAVLSIGDAADIGLAELVRAFGDDLRTEAILIYLEGLTDGPAFLEAVRAVRPRKPVIVLKAGRSQEAARAARSHTGALAGSYDVYRAAFSQVGVVLVETLDELFDAAAVLCRGTICGGDRLGIVSNGGGAGILAVDGLSAVPGRLAELSPETIARLDQLLPAGWSRANPVDIIGDAPPERYAGAIAAVMEDNGVDAVLVMNCPTSLAPGEAVVDQVVRTVAASSADKPVLACWLGENNARQAREAFVRAGIALSETPGDAVRGFSYLAQAAAPLVTAGAAVALPDPDIVDRARQLIAQIRSDGRRTFSEVEAKQLLALFGVPVVPSIHANSPAAVAAACQDMAAPYVVKIVSPDLTHKSDIGGVVLGLADAAAAGAAAEAMLARIRVRAPDARIDGFSVQPMIRRKQAHELFAGIATDPTFGPILMVGAGGTAVEVLADRAIRLPPLIPAEAEAMLAETRVSRLLAGYRDVPATRLEPIVATLLALSGIAQALPEIAELDVNPLLADAEGAVALDARVILTE